MTLQKEEKRKHAKFSASGALKWLRCPGSVALEEKAPPERESEAAATGTRAHSCLEYFFKNSTKLNAARKFLLRQGHPKEMVDHAFDAYQEIKMRHDLAHDAAELLAETEVDLHFIAKGLTKSKMFGTTDAAIIEEFGELTVVDFKYGVGLVEPEQNPQLIYYALGIAHKYGYNFERVRLVIIQPRGQHERGPVREWITTVDELERWADIFREGVAAAEDPKAPLNPGDHCRYCKAKVICPAISNQAMAQARIDFDPHTLKKGVKADLKLPPPSAFGTELHRVLGAIKHMKTWIASVEDYAYNVAREGGKIEGYKLVPKRATRKWADETKVALEAKKVFGERAFKRELLSPAQLEKLDKKTGKDWVAARTVSESSGLALVSDDDKREERTTAQHDFKDHKVIEAEVTDVTWVGLGSSAKKKNSSRHAATRTSKNI